MTSLFQLEQDFEDSNLKKLLDGILAKEYDTDGNLVKLKFDTNFSVEFSKVFKERSCGELIMRLPLKYQILFDHFFRQKQYPSSQVQFYLQDKPKETFAPRHPFGLPIYYHHQATGNSSIIHSSTPGTQQIGMALHFLKAGEQPPVRLLSEVVNPDHHIAPDVSKYVSNNREKVTWRGHKLQLKNGGIFDKNNKVQVEIWLNNMKISWPRVKKVEFFVKENCLEVMVLFKKGFLAGGIIKQRADDFSMLESKSTYDHHVKMNNDHNDKFCNRIWKNSKNSLACHLTEISGTYGTTNFFCGPDFKSMIRVSGMTPAIKQEKKEDLSEKFLENVEKLDQWIDNEQRQQLGRNNICILHTTDDQFLMKFCMSIRSLVNVIHLIGHNLYRLPKESVNWTAHEKLVVIAEQAYELNDSGAPAWKCRNGKQCGMWRRFDYAVRTLHQFPEDSRFQPELSAEFSSQLLTAQGPIRHFFKQGRLVEDTEGQDNLMLLVSPRCLYEWPAYKLLQNFDDIPTELKPLALDILCQRDTPGIMEKIAEIYETEPQLALNVLEKNPHILLFSSISVKPPVKLLNEFLMFMEKLKNEMHLPDSPESPDSSDYSDDDFDDNVLMEVEENAYGQDLSEHSTLSGSSDSDSNDSDNSLNNDVLMEQNEIEENFSDYHYSPDVPSTPSFSDYSDDDIDE